MGKNTIQVSDPSLVHVKGDDGSGGSKKGFLARAEAVMDYGRSLFKRGVSYGGEDEGLHRTWLNCRYPTRLTFGMFYNMYARNSVASRVIETYPDYCWTARPQVLDKGGHTSRFSRAVLDAFLKHYKLMDGIDQSLLSSMKQLDVLGGVGGESLMVFGFRDNKRLSEPVEYMKDMEIAWIKILHNGQFNVDSRYGDDKDPENFGDVEMYITTQFNTEELNFANHIAPNIKIHASRCVHFKEGNNLSFGTSRIQKCYNQLLDITKLAGASAEVYFLGAFSGLSVEVEPEARLDEEVMTSMKDEISKYFEGLARSMVFGGAKAKLLYPAIVSPKDHFDLQVTMVSIATGIPRRFLTGAEAAKLASQQDSLNWTERVSIRRDAMVSPRIVTPVVKRLIMAGVVPLPRDYEFTVTWPKAESITTSERSNASRHMTAAFTEYFSTGMSDVLSFNTYLTYVCGFTDAEAKDIADNTNLDNASKVVKVVNPEPSTGDDDGNNDGDSGIEEDDD